MSGAAQASMHYWIQSVNDWMGLSGEVECERSWWRTVARSPSGSCTRSELGFASVGVYSSDDDHALHARKCDEAFSAESGGPAAYLDVDRLLLIAERSGCTAAVLRRDEYTLYPPGFRTGVYSVRRTAGSGRPLQDRYLPTAESRASSLG
jgi:hypothetical protein